VTIFQFAEGLSDRAAADAVRSHIDWKYTLGLPLDDPGFDATVLVEFRQRLLLHDEARLLFDTLLTKLREVGLVKARGKQRTDSTRVLASVHSYNRLECVWEAMRYALNSLAQVAPDWLREQAPAEWYERYARRPEGFRLTEAQRLTLKEQIGAAGHALLAAVWAKANAPDLCQLPALAALRHIWVQQFYWDNGAVRFRQKDNQPPGRTMSYSPYDLEARLGAKREAEWQGYKVHLTETVTPDGPHLITDVQTDSAPATDREALPEIQARLAERALLPTQQLVDAGYVTAQHLVISQAQHQIDLLGPLAESPSWQAKAGRGFSSRDFQIDWEKQQATCPHGKVSSTWHPTQAPYGLPIVYIYFLKQDCSVCPSLQDCTKAKSQRRTLTVNAQPYYEAMQVARARQQTEEFKEQYKALAGIEGTISQGVRSTDLRHARYRGLAKTKLQHFATAAALNLLRLGAWWEERPKAKTRVSPFLALAPQSM
jgi:transposase